MQTGLHFSPEESSLTVETARTAVFLWLTARKRGDEFSVGDLEGEWKQELVWLGLDWDRKAECGRMPPWAQTLPAVETSPPSPWGQWSGHTEVAELRELGVLPEALFTFLALQGWEVEPQQEVVSRQELVERWPPQSGPPHALAFDFERLRRVNRAWIRQADAERLLDLGLPYWQRAGWVPEEANAATHQWLREVVRAVQPGLDFISLLPSRTRLVFDYHPEHYLQLPESREAMEREGAREVLRQFGQHVLESSWLTVERFRQILDAIKQDSGWRGRNLIQPIRVALTGLPFGPSLDDLIPIFEQGHELDLPVEVKSCRQRVLEFCSIFA